MNRELFVRTVLRRMTRFKGRALLMSLGVVVSVLATVLVASLSGTIRSAFDGFIGRLYPDDGITLVAGSSFMGGGLGRDNLRVKDVEAVAAALPAIVAWDPSNMAGRRDIKIGDRVTRVLVAGSSARYPKVRRHYAMEGAFFTADEVAARSRVALIGPTTARTLFAGSSPVGATLFIDNVPYQVKGLLEPRGMSPHGDDLDDVVMVPYTVVMDSILKMDFLRGASFKVARADDAEAIAEQMRTIMRERHDIRAGQRDDFTVVTPRQMHEMVASTFRTLNLFVVLICAAAFLVSALVLLAVMLASIRQRTPEIGLRKAVGADLAHIRDQVISEVTVIAGAGCAVGIVLAYPLIAIIGPLLAARFGFTGATISLNSIVIATAAALVTGVVGALWPAMRAARLNPVDALRGAR
jgi:putative ABC transport system permease protein